MVTQPSPTQPSVFQLLRQAEQLQPSDFQQLVTGILTLNARRKPNGLPVEEATLLKQINLPFSPKKMDRFLDLDEKRRQQVLTPEEHNELLALVRQLEKFDSRRLQWIAQLALLRKTTLPQMLRHLGLYQSPYV